MVRGKGQPRLPKAHSKLAMCLVYQVETPFRATKVLKLHRQGRRNHNKVDFNPRKTKGPIKLRMVLKGKNHTRRKRKTMLQAWCQAWVATKSVKIYQIIRRKSHYVKAKILIRTATHMLPVLMESYLMCLITKRIHQVIRQPSLLLRSSTRRETRYT